MHHNRFEARLAMALTGRCDCPACSRERYPRALLITVALAIAAIAMLLTSPAWSASSSSAYAPVQKLLEQLHARAAARKSLLPTGTGYTPPPGTAVSWHQGGSAAVAFTVVLNQDVPFTGSEASYWGRYCPGHDCPRELNGPWIGQGMLGTESAGSTTAIAYDALVCHYSARPTDQELFDFTIARFIGSRYLGSPWGDGCGEQPAPTPTPIPRPTPTPTPAPTATPTPAPTATPCPTAQPCPSCQQFTLERIPADVLATIEQGLASIGRKWFPRHPKAASADQVRDWLKTHVKFYEPAEASTGKTEEHKP